MIDGWVISCELALRRMSLDLTDDKSTLVQVMAWCRQATSHYLGQCWPRSLSPYGVTRPQWVNSLYTVWCCYNMANFLTNIHKRHPIAGPLGRGMGCLCGSSISFLAGGKLYQKITIPIFRLVLQNFALPGCSPNILFYSCLFSFLSSGWNVIAVCDSTSVQGSS